MTRLTETERELIAYHETGHAVMRCLLGRPFRGVVLTFMVDGMSFIDGNPPISRRLSKEELGLEIACMIAGAVADQIQADDPDLIRKGSKNDLIQAAKAIRMSGEPAAVLLEPHDLQSLYDSDDALPPEVARDLLSFARLACRRFGDYPDTLLRENWSKVKAVAKQLLLQKKGRLNSDQVQQIMDEIAPES